MAANINRVVLVGNLTRDPELRHSPSGTPVCSLRVAVNTRRKDETGQWTDKPNYFDITVWGKQGENCASTSPRAARSPSTAASSGASGKRRTAPSGRRSRSSPTASSSWAGAWRARPRRTSRPVPPAETTSRPPRRRTTTFRSRRVSRRSMASKKTATPSRRRAAATSAPGKRKSCHFCRDKVDEIDYKNVAQLRRYISEKGKIRSRRITGACRRHQLQVATAVKRAREMALLPYVAQ